MLGMYSVQGTRYCRRATWDPGFDQPRSGSSKAESAMACTTDEQPCEIVAYSVLH